MSATEGEEIRIVTWRDTTAPWNAAGQLIASCSSPQTFTHGDIMAGRADWARSATTGLAETIAAEIRSTLERGHAAVVTAETPDGDVVGAAWMERHESGGRVTAVLQDIAVAPTSRHRGLGRSILQEVLRVSSAWSATAVLLETSLRNRRAQQFFTDLGFEPLAMTMFINLPPLPGSSR